MKFNIAYFMGTKQLCFQRYPLICELETQHIGSCYLHDNVARTLFTTSLNCNGAVRFALVPKQSSPLLTMNSCLCVGATQVVLMKQSTQEWVISLYTSPSMSQQKVTSLIKTCSVISWHKRRMLLTVQYCHGRESSKCSGSGLKGLVKQNWTWYITQHLEF